MRLRRVTLGALAILLLGALLAGCSSDDGDDVEAGADDTTTTAATQELDEAHYVENAPFVDAADWDTATELTVELGEMYFKPSDLTFEAGKPYVVSLPNKGEEKHELAAEDFFRSVAVRKVEDADAEVKVPYFTEMEVFAGKSTELFFVAVMPGTYEMFCAIDGHREKGMEGTITVTGDVPTDPKPVLAEIAKAPWLEDGEDVVEAANWDGMQTLRVELGEMYFKPKDVALKANTPYKLELVNAGTEKHEVVAEDFFGTIAFRKAEDSVGEYKGPTVREVEVFAGKQLDLYVIPTKAGSYLLVCEIEGHREKGMEGTITVSG